MATLAVTRRFDLSDEQWARLEPLLPVPVRPGRPSKWTKRQLIDGIRWRIRVGAPWRDVPCCYGSWRAVYGLFRRWQRDGTWAKILSGLQAWADAAGLITWQVSVDSTVMRAHQHAAGARRRGELQAEPPGGIAALGRKVRGRLGRRSADAEILSGAIADPTDARIARLAEALQNAMEDDPAFADDLEAALRHAMSENAQFRAEVDDRRARTRIDATATDGGITNIVNGDVKHQITINEVHGGMNIN
ncbi:IS5 family transposase [Actinomadura sp. 9N215]|uniref:IS5 family transposase n=1 Tax=Actinomadura sp. 9N215 TaxID=3375150 RepID=UPI0037BB13AF